MQSNEGVKYSNIDTTSGALAPLKDNKDLNANLKPSIAYFNEHWIDSDENRDYVKFQDKIFYSNGQTRPQWSPNGYNWFQLGIDSPSEAPTVTATVSQEVPAINVLTGQIGNPSQMSQDFLLQGFMEDTNYLADIKQYRLNVSNSNVYCRVVKKWNFYYTTPTSLYGFFFKALYPSYYLNNSSVYVKSRNTEKYSKVNYRQSPVNPNAYTYPIMNIQPSNNPTQTYLDELEILNLEDKELNIIGVESGDFGSVIYSTTIKTPKLEVIQDGDKDINVEFILSLQIAKLNESSTKLKLFINGVNFEVELGKDGNFYTIGEITALKLEDYLNSESIYATSYLYTYVSSDGTESTPSKSASIPDKFYPAYISVQASEDPQVTRIKLYRQNSQIGGGYQLVKEYPNITQTIVDYSSDSAIDGAALASYNYLPAPDGLRHLTLYNVMLFGSIADKLYYTDVANPYAWSGFNYIDFDDTITGIGGTSNGLLVFTRTSTYIVTGTSPDSFSKYLLSSGVGCVLHKSIQPRHNSLVWLSEDSVCSSNGGEIQNLSMSKLGVLDIKTPRCSAILNDIYYLSHQDGTLITDFRFDLVFRESDKVYLGLSVNGNQLFGVEDSGKLVELHKGQTPLSIDYLSPKFSDGSISTLKTYKDIYFHSTGDLTAKVFIDDKMVGTKLLAKGFDELKVSSENTRGYSIQFDISGTGTLNEIEYKVESRQNGR